MYSLHLTSIFHQVQEYLEHNCILLFVFLSWYLDCYQKVDNWSPRPCDLINGGLSTISGATRSIIILPFVRKKKGIKSKNYTFEHSVSLRVRLTHGPAPSATGPKGVLLAPRQLSRHFLSISCMRAKLYLLQHWEISRLKRSSMYWTWCNMGICKIVRESMCYRQKQTNHKKFWLESLTERGQLGEWCVNSSKQLKVTLTQYFTVAQT